MEKAKSAVEQEKLKCSKKVFVVGFQTDYRRWIKNHVLVTKLEEADIVIFTGGEDVDPSLYNCKKHPSTMSNLHRDLEEKEIFEKVQPHQLCVGICRGLKIVAHVKHGELLEHLKWQPAA